MTDVHRKQLRQLMDLVRELQGENFMHKDLSMKNILVCADDTCAYAHAIPGHTRHMHILAREIAGFEPPCHPRQ